MAAFGVSRDQHEASFLIYPTSHESFNLQSQTDKLDLDSITKYLATAESQPEDLTT